MRRVDPFPASDFDQWADSYDEDVVAHSQFPFAGYPQVLESVVKAAAPRSGMTVLDVGVGTGNLAKMFLDADCRVWGADYSPAMLARSKKKLPEVTLVLHDVRSAWPGELNLCFDRIVSAYTFHHFELERKVRILVDMSKDHLDAGGKIVIADVSFASSRAMRAFATTIGDLWEEEPYWLADDAQDALMAAGLQCSYEQISTCGGVYAIERG